MRADYDKAATKALEVIVDNWIHNTPIDPLPVLKKQKGVMVRSLTDLSETAHMTRSFVKASFGKNMDAMTFHIDNQNCQYVVFYNQRLPF